MAGAGDAHRAVVGHLRGTGPLVTLTYMPRHHRRAGWPTPPSSWARRPDAPTGATGAASGLNLTLPDGSRWYPPGPFRLESAADLPFVLGRSARGRRTADDVAVGSLESALGRGRRRR